VKSVRGGEDAGAFIEIAETWDAKDVMKATAKRISDLRFKI